MRRPGADETRELVFAEAEDRERQRQQAEQGPTESEKFGARMLVESVGLQNTDAASPMLKDIHTAFTKVREQGAPIRTATTRIQNSPLPTSNRRFMMSRDWDDTETKK